MLQVFALLDVGTFRILNGHTMTTMPIFSIKASDHPIMSGLVRQGKDRIAPIQNHGLTPQGLDRTPVPCHQCRGCLNLHGRTPRPGRPTELERRAAEKALALATTGVRQTQQAPKMNLSGSGSRWVYRYTNELLIYGVEVLVRKHQRLMVDLPTR